jgi:hypothetical protein
MARFALIVVLTLPFGGWGLMADETKAEGKEMKPLLVMKGGKSKIEEASCQRITSSDDWKKLWAQHKTGSPDQKNLPDDLECVELDFDRFMVVAVFDGVSDSQGYFGLGLETTKETDARITVRVISWYAQTTLDGLGGKPGESLEEKQARQKTYWLFIVLPRSDKELVIESDHGRREGDKHAWKELKRIPALAK